ncbi:MAG: dihydrolipoyllysine-residue succinyltransferase component of 2-oxoglutarate dehydrogenase complex [marine bacterium B5-7]|nr:MAG: dihydrolipoyllysine-residue succinyltransferase component of 2-oxoglutarate dehydrogenase complex [marine bacterium B5-7]
MPSEIKVPTLPESVSEATVLEWHKKEGDFVRRDETLVDIETEKVVLEVPSPQDGILGALKHDAGDTVQEGDLLAKIEDGDAPADGESSPEDSAPSQNDSSSDSGDRDRHGPAVRALLDEHDIDPSKISGTGKDGRIIKEDVQNYLKSAKQTAPAATSAPKPDTAPKAASDAKPQPLPSITGGRDREETRNAMSRIRQTIAKRLVKAQQTAAMLTTFNEVDMTTVMAMRNQYKKDFEESHGARLGFMSFFVKAVAAALTRFPMVNAFIDGTDVVQHNYADIGIAVSSPRGLLVPILRDADLKSFARIEAEISDFGARAKKAAITMEELTGGTFTITNGGVFGSLLSTPILNPPQSAILGMHKIQERPMAENGEVVIRPMMYLALSYDHRIVDGKEAVQFLVNIKQAVEDPSRLLLEL